MAVTALALGYTPEKGIDYTHTVDSAADYGAVPDNTYFYNLDDKLPYYKDGTGAIISVFESGGGGGDSIYTASGNVFAGAVATMSDAAGLTFKGFDDINNTLIRGENNTGTQIFEINNRGGLSIDHQIASGQILDLDNLGSARYQLGSDGQVNWWSTGTSTKYKVSSGAKVREDKEAGGFDFFDGALNTQIRIHPTADNWFSGTGVTKFLVGGTSSLGGQLIQLQDDTYIVGDTQIDGALTLNNGLVNLGYTSSTAAPTTTELPADKNYSIHKDTSGGTVYLAYNDGGVIKTVTLT